MALKWLQTAIVLDTRAILFGYPIKTHPQHSVWHIVLDDELLEWVV
ncbi:MAG: hypothetical protein J6U80_05975 [Bacteroidales bacterium]|nr:hypothetical protein [Bacteroidales bacterium]